MEHTEVQEVGVGIRVASPVWGSSDSEFSTWSGCWALLGTRPRDSKFRGLYHFTGVGREESRSPPPENVAALRVIALRG